MTNTRPTVCHVLHTLGVGGAEMLATRLARRFSGLYRTVFACLDELGTLGEELAAEGFPVHVLGRRPGLDLGCVFRLARLLRRERVDVAHAHQYTPFFYALAARRLARHPTILFTEHGRHYPDHPRWKRKIFNRLLLEQRDRVVGVGGAVRQALIRNEGIPSHRVQVIINGIESERFAADRSTRAEVRRELALGSDDLVLLQVARLDPLKDHATALAALSHVVHERPATHLLLAGDGPLRGEIEGRARALGLEPHVRLLGTRRDVDRLLAAADVMLLTSISEGIPLTLLEAMAAGLPVVATRVGGVGEVVEHGRTGLLVQAGDDMTLAQAVLTLADSPVLRNEMGQHGRQRMEQFFSEKRMRERYGELYRELTGERRPSAGNGLPLPDGCGSFALSTQDRP